MEIGNINNRGRLAGGRHVTKFWESVWKRKNGKRREEGLGPGWKIHLT